MRAMALALIKGMLDEVAGELHVSWVQPRVLDHAQMASRDALTARHVCSRLSPSDAAYLLSDGAVCQSRVSKMCTAFGGSCSGARCRADGGVGSEGAHRTHVRRRADARALRVDQGGRAAHCPQLAGRISSRVRGRRSSARGSEIRGSGIGGRPWVYPCGLWVACALIKRNPAGLCPWLVMEASFPNTQENDTPGQGTVFSK